MRGARLSAMSLYPTSFGQYVSYIPSARSCIDVTEWALKIFFPWARFVSVIVASAAYTPILPAQDHCPIYWWEECVEPKLWLQRHFQIASLWMNPFHAQLQRDLDLEFRFSGEPCRASIRWNSGRQSFFEIDGAIFDSLGCAPNSKRLTRWFISQGEKDGLHQ